MDTNSILELLDADRRTLARHGEMIDVRPHVTRLCASDGSHHAVLWSALSAGNADAVIASEVEHHRALGVEFEWKLYSHDAPADLLQRLKLAGFAIDPPEAVLVLDLHHPPDWIDTPSAHQVMRIDRVEQVEWFRRAAEQVFGKDYSFTSNQLLEAIRADSIHHRGYVAMADGEPASIGRLYTHPQSAFGGLYGGGTVQSHRGKGLYRAVVAARARDAIALGARCLIVDALPTSRPILERLGFAHVADTWPCVWRP